MTDWPVWNSIELYDPGNQVNFGGQIWQCLVTNTNSQPSQANRNWDIITTYPPWSDIPEYLAGDVVSYGGQLYVAQHSSNEGAPGDMPIVPDSGATFTVKGPDGDYTPLYWIQLGSLYPPPTIYPGDNAQLPDSLISASEGAALTPGYRGLIYCVWENLWLGNFADRIPSFRAEVTYTKVGTLV